ncbi:phage protein Gp36 family protein [Bosea vestrisii]|uniref:Phage protein Gp36 family protein n=1 Tax=Bosea vestrisii TaxID=151416 RepID=A0ABW0H749_9HYPH
MTILTVAAFVARIGEAEALNLAGQGPRGEETVDATKLTPALDYAHSLMIGKLRARFPEGLPEPTPEILIGIAIDLSIYRLRYKTGDQSGVQDETYRRYQAALKLLDQIAAGEILLTEEERPGSPEPVLVAGEPPRANKILDGWR